MNKTIWLGFLILLFIPFVFAAEGYGNSTYGNSTYGNITSPTTATATAAVTFSTNPAASSITSSTVVFAASTSRTATCRYAPSASIGYGDMAAFSSTGGTSHSTTVSGLSSGNGYAYTVICRDGDSNDVTNSVSFTTTSSSGGSGGGGSGGSTASAAVIGQSAKELWAVIKKGEAVSLKIDNGAIGVVVLVD